MSISWLTGPRWCPRRKKQWCSQLKKPWRPGLMIPAWDQKTRIKQIYSSTCIRNISRSKARTWRGLTWQTQLLHLVRSTAVLGLTSDIVWIEGKGLERTQIQQLGSTACSLTICLRGEKLSGQSCDPSLFPLSGKKQNKKHTQNINWWNNSSYWSRQSDSDDYTSGCTYWDNKPDTLSNTNKCGNTQQHSSFRKVLTYAFHR